MRTTSISAHLDFVTYFYNSQATGSTNWYTFSCYNLIFLVQFHADDYIISTGQRFRVLRDRVPEIIVQDITSAFIRRRYQHYDY